jgi:hypothetical protein
VTSHLDRDEIASPVRGLSDAERQVYAMLADRLIPRAEGMPAASEAGVPTRWIDEALRFRPDLAIPLRRALELAHGEDPDVALALVNSRDPEAFEALGTLTAGAYFLNPETRELVGYPGQVSKPIRDDVDDYIDMLARVVERGPFYREVPDSGT